MELLQIEIVKADPELETLRYIAAISGGLVVLLLFVIAYFLKDRNKLINELSKEVIHLTKNLAVLNQYIEDCIPDLKKEVKELNRKMLSQGEDLIRIRSHIGMNGNGKNKYDEKV